LAAVRNIVDDVLYAARAAGQLSLAPHSLLQARQKYGGRRQAFLLVASVVLERAIVQHARSDPSLGCIALQAAKC
jgi:hypothetical protein